MIARYSDGNYVSVDARESPGMTVVIRREKRRASPLESPVRRVEMPGDRGFMNPGKPRFRGCSVNSGNRLGSRTDSDFPENLPSLCHPCREGRKTLPESALAEIRLHVSIPADSEDYFRFPELITKKRLEIKSFLLFFAGFSGLPRRVPPYAFFLLNFNPLFLLGDVDDHIRTHLTLHVVWKGRTFGR